MPPSARVYGVPFPVLSQEPATGIFYFYFLNSALPVNRKWLRAWRQLPAREGPP